MNLQKKYVKIVKLFVLGGIVVIKCKDYTQAKCCDYEQKEKGTKYQKPLTRTAKQHKALMKLEQMF